MPNESNRCFRVFVFLLALGLELTTSGGLCAQEITNVLVSGQTVTNSVSNTERTNVYTFEGTSEEVLTLRAVITTNRSANIGVVVMRLFGAEGDVLAEDIQATFRPDRIAFVHAVKLPETGSYRVEVWDGYQGTGAFDYA